MAATAFTHVSDLHIGLSPAVDSAAEQLCEALLREQGPVLMTGDITHNGKKEELERFHDLFAPLLDTGRVVVLPGNHDRLGDDLRDAFMPGPRVQAERFAGLWIVRLDSTGLHNRRWLEGHGEVTLADIDDVHTALTRAPAGLQSILMLHHHPLPLVHDHPMELLVTLLGWPNARELRTGEILLGRIRGLCDAVLHGHRHVPAALNPYVNDPRSLRIFSGGSSTQQRGYRAFRDATKAACWTTLEQPDCAMPQLIPA